MHSGERWRLGRRPALDGLRGVAILLVLVGHAGPRGLQLVAWIGVTLFFGLSGFLITALLLEERATSGRIRLTRFWKRRARRLLPALVAMTALMTAFLVGAGLQANPLPVLAYYGNWTMAAGGDLGAWRHTWSLAIEEQFYLAWPLVILLMRTRHAVTIACAVGIACSLAASAAHWSDFHRVYYGTDTRAWALLIGCLIAARLVGTVRRERPVPAWLTRDVLRWFGRRSYGIYLWHYPLTLMMPPLAGIALGIALAEASWWLVERPFSSHGKASRLEDTRVVGNGRQGRPARGEDVRLNVVVGGQQ